jgi:hypothetical protein
MRTIARVTRTLFAASTLFATACTSVYTIDDVITESAAITDDRLLGEWREVDGSDRARVSRGTGRDYQVAYMDSEDSVQFRVRLGRLGSTVALDAYPDLAQWNARKESGVPRHLVYTIEFRGDSLGLRGIKGDSVKKVLGTGRLRVPYSQVNGELLLHGDPAGVRAALAEIVEQGRLMEDIVWYRRLR